MAIVPSGCPFSVYSNSKNLALGISAFFDKTSAFSSPIVISGNLTLILPYRSFAILSRLLSILSPEGTNNLLVFIFLPVKHYLYDDTMIGNGASQSSSALPSILNNSKTLGSHSDNITLILIINNTALTKSSFLPFLALKLAPDAM